MNFIYDGLEGEGQAALNSPHSGFIDFRGPRRNLDASPKVEVFEGSEGPPGYAVKDMQYFIESGIISHFSGWGNSSSYSGPLKRM
jgi:hypothetical protein